MKKKCKLLLQLIIILFPWKIRRILLNKLLKYNIHETAKINLSIILSEKLYMGCHSRIGSFTICNNIDSLILNEYSRIGTFNYITGFPSNLKTHFCHLSARKCELNVGDHSAITSRHFLDCTAGITIGKFTTVAGIRSQLLTHSMDLYNNRQDAKPIIIGDYCFLGTNCVILPGSELPSYSVLGAKSLLNKSLIEEDCIYGGVPISKIKKLNRDKIAYFNRTCGFVK